MTDGQFVALVFGVALGLPILSAIVEGVQGRWR